MKRVLLPISLLDSVVWFCYTDLIFGFEAFLSMGAKSVIAKSKKKEGKKKNCNLNENPVIRLVSPRFKIMIF